MTTTETKQKYKITFTQLPRQGRALTDCEIDNLVTINGFRYTRVESGDLDSFGNDARLELLERAYEELKQYSRQTYTITS